MNSAVTVMGALGWTLIGLYSFALPVKSATPAESLTAGAHATARPGEWVFPGGTTLRLYGEVFHATDVMTTALISWPEQDDRPPVQWHTGIASDAFANREKWAVAWENEKPVLWVACRSLGSSEKTADGRAVANRLKRIDFSDPSHIREEYFQGGWPETDGPTPGVVTQLAAHIEVRQGGSLSTTLYSWASAGAVEKIDLSAVQNIHLTVQPDDGIVIDILELRRTCSLETLADTLATLRTEWTAKRGSSLLGKAMVPRVTVSAFPDTAPEAITRIRAACVTAGCGPFAGGTEPGTSSADRMASDPPGKRSLPAPAIVKSNTNQLALGPPREDGLRAAWVLNPQRNEYQIGDIVKCAVWFYNDGKAAITFTTDAWHQFDTWKATRADGSPVEVRTTWYSGLTPQETITLQPRESHEIPAHGVGIGNAEFAERYSRAELGAELWAEPGDEVTCVWEVAVSPGDTGRLTTGPVTFRVAPAPPAGPKPPIVTDRLGSYNLGQGAILNLSQIGSADGFANYAWITWEKARGAAGNGKADIAMPRSADPQDHSLPTFVLSRTVPFLWIVEDELIRKIDFSSIGETKEVVWPRADAPADFGDAPEDVRKAIQKLSPSTAGSGRSDKSTLPDD